MSCGKHLKMSLPEVSPRASNNISSLVSSLDYIIIYKQIVKQMFDVYTDHNVTSL